MSESETRIAELEIKLALTEDHLDQLNKTIFRQQQQLDLLQAQLRELHRQVHSADGDSGSSSPRSEIPPHY
jgi:SlyX protein